MTEQWFVQELFESEQTFIYYLYTVYYVWNF